MRVYNVGMKIEYSIVRSDRKTVGISVTDGGAVTVRAPRLLSKKEIEKIVQKHEDWILAKIRERGEIKEPVLSNEDEWYLRVLAKGYLSERVRYWSAVTGLCPERIRISSAKKRFGSCSSKGTVSFSFFVMLYPAEAIDLVVVHELCHLRHMDHSKDFYSLLSRFIPDCKDRKKLLSAKNMHSVEEVREMYAYR